VATWLKQSTAVDVALGPFVDATDGVTPETGLSLTQAECRLKKNGGAWAQKNQASTAAHEEEGWYEVNLDATDTNTLGVLVLAVYVSGALPCWWEFLVVPANVYDSLVGGSDLLQADLQQWVGTAPLALTSQLVQAQGNQLGTQAKADVNAEADTALADYDAPTFAELDARTDAIEADTQDLQARTPAALVGGRTDAHVGSVADAVLTAAKFAAGALDAVWSVAARTLTAFGFSVTVGTNNDKTGYALTTAEKDDIVDRAWDEDVDASHQTAGSAGKKLDDAGAGGSPPTVAQIADGVWDEAIAGHLGAGSTGSKLNAAAGVAGSGGLQRTIGVTVGGNPLQGALVWVATDAAGSNVVAGPLSTSSQGVVTVLLDAGTYYVWVRKDGYNPVVAQQVTVS